MDAPVTAFDLTRMLLGDEPPLFLLEIAARTIIIYAYTLLLIRWIGSRSISQLSRVEFLLVIALGSAVGDAMFYPDVPLLHAIVVITIVVLLDKALGFAVSRSPRLEDVIEGRSVQVVHDGLIKCEALNDLNFGHDELFEQLRLREVRHLGQVRAAYLETNGLLSVFKTEAGAERPGLPIDPPWDVKQPHEIKSGEAVGRHSRHLACPHCGNTEFLADEAAVPDCQTCGSKIWHECSAGAAG